MLPQRVLERVLRQSRGITANDVVARSAWNENDRVVMQALANAAEHCHLQVVAASAGFPFRHTELAALHSISRRLLGSPEGTWLGVE